MSAPRVTRERLPDGRLVERIHVPGPTVKRKRIAKAGEHPEEREQFETFETYSGEEVREWAEALGREGERGKVDGVLSGTFPRISRLAEAMAAAGIDAADLASAAALPAPLVSRLAETGELPEPAHREAIEAAGFPDAFPERREAASMAEQIQGASSTPSAAGQAAEAERGQRSRRRDAARREAAEAAQRREREAQRRRAELDTGLGKVLSRFERLSRRLDRQ